MSRLNKNSRLLSVPQFRSRSALKPLKIVSGTRPLSAKQCFEASNQRKNEEAWRLEGWKSAVTEFQRREWQTKFYNSLSDSRNRNLCNNDWKVSQEKENLLLDRKCRLRKLLGDDDQMYEKERQMKIRRKIETECGTQVHHPEVEMLKRRLDDLKKKNEEEKQKISDKLSYEVWRKNQSEIRQMESERINKFVQEAWVDQAQWKEDQRRKSEEDRERMEKEAEEMRYLKDEEDARMEKEVKERHARWKEELNEQLQKIREREEKEVILKRKEDSLQRERNKLDELLQRREQIVEARKRKELELFWARQHQLKLKKKALIIQNELIQDQLLIEDFLKGISGTTLDNEVEQKKEEAEWMRNVLEEQKRLEKLREKEYDLLFSEEARQMWERRQAEWNKEQKARDCLMKDVLMGLQKQIDDKMVSIVTSIDKSKEERFTIVSEMKQMQNRIDEEEKEQMEGRAHRQPIADHQDKHFSENASKSAIYERVMQAQTASEHKREIARLEDEIKRLWQSSYVPPRHGRKKVAW